MCSMESKPEMCPIGCMQCASKQHIHEAPSSKGYVAHMHVLGARVKTRCPFNITYYFIRERLCCSHARFGYKGEDTVPIYFEALQGAHRVLRNEQSAALHACTHTQLYMDTCIHTHARTSTPTPTYARANTHTHTHTHIRKSAHTHTHQGTHAACSPETQPHIRLSRQVAHGVCHVHHGNLHGTWGMGVWLGYTAVMCIVFKNSIRVMYCGVCHVHHSNLGLQGGAWLNS